MAHRFQLVDELRDAEQCGHRAERQAAEVLRKPGCDDARAVGDERVDRVDDPLVEELHLVDSDRVVTARERCTSAPLCAVTARILAPACDTTCPTS